MEVEKIDTAITETFKIDIFKVRQMVKEYQSLILIPEDEGSYKICRTALTSCIRTRTGIDKRRLKLNKDDQDRIKARNVAAKQLVAVVEPAESHLEALVKGEDARKEAIQAKEEKRQLKITQKRIDDLLTVECVMPFLQVATLTDDEFQCLLSDKTFEFEERQKERAEAERLEKERLAKEAADRKAEDERLAKQKADQDAKEAELKKQADNLAAQQKAIDDERARIAKAEADKKAAEEAKIQAAKDAEDLAKHQAKEAAEAEEKAKVEAARQEALIPDIDKLEDFANYLQEAIEYPELKSDEAKEILKGARKQIYDIGNEIFVSIEGL